MPGGGALFRTGKKTTDKWSKAEIKAAKPARKPEDKKKRKRKEEEDPNSDKEEDLTPATDNNMEIQPTHRNVEFKDITGDYVNKKNQYIICQMCWNKNFYTVNNGRYKYNKWDRPTLEGQTDGSEFVIEIGALLVEAEGILKPMKKGPYNRRIIESIIDEHYTDLDNRCIDKTNK